MTNLHAVPFHEKSYWESRFEKEKHFEWLLTWKSVKDELALYLKKDEDILHLGCGNSELAFDISDDGYKSVINVDYAENVIEYMKSVTQEKERTLNKDYSGISWLTGDCLNDLRHNLPNDQYTVIIDKGLTDAIACGDDHQQSHVKQLSNKMLSIAKIGGYWFSISFSGEREFYCDNQEDTYWSTEKKIPIEVHQPNDKPGAPAIYYYLYISRKMEKQR